MAVSPLDHAASPWGAARARSTRGRPIRANLRAWLHGWELDRELAAGCSPETDAALAIRAHRITSRRSRRRSADGLARALRAIEPGRPVLTAAARPNLDEVRAARTVLASLERRLRANEQIAPRGAAMLGLLLSDCTSQLYQPAEQGALGSALRAAAAALELPERRAEQSLVAPEAARDEALR
jgi:hypothetical protein